MILAGGWLRPECYERGDGRDTALAGEIACVRQRVGLLDVSPLGKIELRGRDAGEFLDRLYTMSYATLPRGKTRYLLMVNEAGYIIDDGVTYRVDDDFFYVTATTSSVERTFRAMLRWRALWKLNVSIVNVTNAFAALNVAGPRAREVLRRLHTTIDVSSAAFPYLAGRSGLLEGAPVRMMRIGFVGELGYEIHFPAEHAELLWDALLHAGARDGLQPVGLQALRALRLEKAHIIVGQDTDPLTWPDEVGMQWAISRKKPFYVGKPSIDLMRARRLTRRLVGFRLPVEAPLPQESELVVDGARPLGHITSVTRSSACSSIVGLAFVDGHEHAAGSELQILSGGRILKATVVEGSFYDPEGKRQEM
jgi:sarcosine oxidase subunit alpha